MAMQAGTWVPKVAVNVTVVIPVLDGEPAGVNWMTPIESELPAVNAHAPVPIPVEEQVGELLPVDTMRLAWKVVVLGTCTEPPLGERIKLALVIVVEIVVAAPDVPVICNPLPVWTNPVPLGDKITFEFVVGDKVMFAADEIVVAAELVPVKSKPPDVWTNPVPLGDRITFEFVVGDKVMFAADEIVVAAPDVPVICNPLFIVTNPVLSA
jgi:hypothetical protein